MDVTKDELCFLLRQIMGKVTLKQALTHEENILGAAVLLTSLAIDDTQESRDWFLNRVIPAALPYYQPITVSDPCVGSGVMLLAAASQFPTWAVHANLVQFFGQDIDPTCVKMSRINGQLYGLNGYACHLTQSFAENARVYFQQRIANVYFQERMADNDKSSVSTTGPTFADLFKQTG